MKRLNQFSANKTYIWQHANWPQFTWDLGKLAQTLGHTRFVQGQLLNQIQMLGFDFIQEARSEILIEEAIKTSAIEGKHLDDQTVRSSVAKQLGLPFAGIIKQDHSVDGLVEVLIDATKHATKKLSGKRIKGWQAALFPTGYSGLHKITVGEFRKTPISVVSGPIHKEKTHFEAPPEKCLKQEMSGFIKWWQQSLGHIDGLIRAGVAHLYFVTIHPFEDGNGRIARAITDMALSQDEKISERFYSFSSQIMVERNTYYEQLESAQKGTLDITEWLLWFLECIHRSIERSQKIIARILIKTDFLRHHSSIEISTRQRKVINRLLQAGGFEGGLTTRKYVSLAKVSRATAYREIADLLSKGLIKPKQGGGRNVSYEINEL
jgi:Fic family protein